MWSHQILDTMSSEQFENYLDLICKSSLIYGSSNNLELGLHILTYFKGDFRQAIKGFLDDTIDLPVNHPISTYKYSGKLFHKLSISLRNFTAIEILFSLETDIWTQSEIKKFELALLKCDKVFSDIADQIETKTYKQCIEFYYLWKKVMSDGMRKKWRNFKRNRVRDDVDTIEQNLRSRTKNADGGEELANEAANGDELAENNINNDMNDNDECDDELENDLFDEILQHQEDCVDLNNNNNNTVKNRPSRNRQLNGDKNASRYSSPSPPSLCVNAKEHECKKCNLVCIL
jgi:hypothetical protein